MSDFDSTESDKEQRESDQCNCRYAQKHANGEDDLFHELFPVMNPVTFSLPCRAD
jgi:hypothetical protein